MMKKMKKLAATLATIATLAVMAPTTTVFAADSDVTPKIGSACNITITQTESHTIEKITEVSPYTKEVNLKEIHSALLKKNFIPLHVNEEHTEIWISNETLSEMYIIYYGFDDVTITHIIVE